MHAGTLAKLPQLGALGLVALANAGLVPKVLFGPKENPVLLTMLLLFPNDE